MPRQPSPELREELDSLHRVLRVFAAVLRPELGPGQAELMETAVDGAYRARSLSGLHMARDDLVAMADALPAPRLRELDAMLREQAGVSLDDLQARRLACIARVRERGRITADEQYHLVRERVEKIWDDPAEGGRVPCTPGPARRLRAAPRQAKLRPRSKPGDERCRAAVREGGLRAVVAANSIRPDGGVGRRTTSTEAIDRCP